MIIPPWKCIRYGFRFSFILPLSPSLTLIVVNKNRHHSRIANDIIYQQMYLNMLCSLFFLGSHNFFSVSFSFLQWRSSSSTFLLSFDRISFDFLSIFSHFLYATGFTDQLLSLWFVCLAIFFHSAHSFAPSLSRAFQIVPFRFLVFDKFTECANRIHFCFAILLIRSVDGVYLSSVYL